MLDTQSTTHASCSCCDKYILAEFSRSWLLRAILEHEPQRRWHPWHRHYRRLHLRFWSPGDHRSAVVSLAPKTFVATTQLPVRSHLALQLCPAHSRKLDRCQPLLEHSTAGLVDLTRTECGGRTLVGLVVFSAALTPRIGYCSRIRLPVHHPAFGDLLSRVPRTWHCVRAISNLVSHRHISRFRLRLTNHINHSERLLKLINYFPLRPGITRALRKVAIQRTLAIGHRVNKQIATNKSALP